MAVGGGVVQRAVPLVVRRSYDRTTLEQNIYDLRVAVLGSQVQGRSALDVGDVDYGVACWDRQFKTFLP